MHEAVESPGRSYPRVVVADDHPAVLDAVCSVLEADGIEIVARVPDGAAARAEIEAHRPPVALLDVRMPYATGIEIAREIARSAPGTAVILYTAYADRALLTEALDSGARGFVLKEAPLPELVRAVKAVAEGGTYVDAVLAG